MEDVVEANVLALTGGGGEMMNIGTGVGTSVNDIFRELKALLGFVGDPIYDAARPGEVQRIYLDASRAARIIGWHPRVTFVDGLRRTIEWSRGRNDCDVARVSGRRRARIRSPTNLPHESYRERAGRAA